MNPTDGRIEKPSLRGLMTRERWFEIARIVIVGFITLLYWRNVLPLPALWVTIAFEALKGVGYW